MTLRTALFGVTGLLFAYLGYGVVGVLVGKLLATVFVFTVGYWLIFRRFDAAFLFRSSPDYLPKRDIITFNSFSIILTILMMSLYHVDLLMIRSLLGSVQTGYYKAAIVVAEFLWFVPIAVQLALLQSISPLWSQDRVDQITQIAARITRYTLLITLLMGIGIAILARPFINLYFGPTYAVAVLPLLVLLPGSLCFAVARPIIAIGQAKGDLRPLIIGTGVAAVLNIVLNAILIPRYGIVGAAVATSTSYGSMIVIHVLTSRFLGFDPLADLRPIRIGLTAVIAATVLSLVVRVIESPFLLLTIVPPLGLLIYGLVAVETGAVHVQEVKSLIDRLPVPTKSS